MSHNPKDRCTNCGGTGHSRSDCPWPKPGDEAATKKRPPVFRGWRAYAQIMRALRHPATTKGLAERLGCSYLGLLINVRRMAELGLVREMAWQRARGNWEAVWCADDKPRTPHPTKGAPKIEPVKAYRRRSEMLAFSHVVSCLREGVTLRVMEDRTGCCYNNLARLMRFSESIGFARVSAWEVREDGCGAPSAVWSLGAGKRAPRPQTMTRQEIDRRNQAKRKAKAQMQALLAATAGAARDLQGASAC